MAVLLPDPDAHPVVVRRLQEEGGHEPRHLQGVAGFDLLVILILLCMAAVFVLLVLQLFASGGDSSGQAKKTREELEEE